jgi:aspartyl-tRNA(Asn)/glutamyl-tRNA(Gln) amidotransferase subunit A
MTQALHDQSVTQLAAALKAKHVSATEVAQHFLARAKADTTGSFLALNEEATLVQAKAADARLAAGTGGLLEGVPLAHKDVFVTRDFPTTAGSKILSGYRSPFDATVVSRLAAQGMVTLGKVNCDEFAMGSSNENSAYGAVKNPWDASRIPGGSSGGSAAAVAARLTPASTGTDTGGSIRQPASFCGITGIKPTYGRASRYGMIAYASSLDQAGPMARSAEDCALLLSAMCGADVDRDATSLDLPTEDFSAQLGNSLHVCAWAFPKNFLATAWLPTCARPSMPRSKIWKTKAPNSCPSACPAPSWPFPCTTSLPPPKPAPT